MQNDDFINSLPSASLDNADFTIDASAPPGSASADAFWALDTGGAPGQVLRRISLRQGESAVIRPLTKQPHRVSVHYRLRDPDGRFLALLCNADRGGQCACCLSHHRATDVYLLTVFHADEGNLAVLPLYKDAGPGSLRTQLARYFGRPDYFNQVLEVSRGQQRYSVRLLHTVDPKAPAPAGVDYGDAVLRELQQTGLPTEADLEATFERWDNLVMLQDVEGLERKVRLHHPHLDFSQL